MKIELLLFVVVVFVIADVVFFFRFLVFHL